MMKYARILAGIYLFVSHLQVSSAFSPIAAHHASANTAGRSAANDVPAVTGSRLNGPLYTSSDEDDASSGSEESNEATPAAVATASTPPPAVQESEKSEVPLDVPSPILLASSMVLAIASTGSIFELLGGSPQLGMAPTAAIAVLGTPLCFFLFYAAIVKGNAETEADDQRFMDNNKGSSSGFF